MNDTRTHDDDARDLRLMMDQALVDTMPSVTGLGDLAASTGRRVRRRRRLLLGSVAAVVVLGAGWSAPRLGAGTEGTGVASDNSSSPRPSTSALTPDPNWQPDNPGWWSMPASLMAQTLGGVLPDGITVDQFTRDNLDHAPDEPLHELAGDLQASVKAADGSLGSIQIMLSPPVDPADTASTTASAAPNTVAAPSMESYAQRIRCPGNLEAPSSCQPLLDEQGHHYGRSSVWSDGAVVIYEVAVRTDDRGLVYGATVNSIDNKWGAGSGTTTDLPPLTREQLRTIVESGVWRSYVPAS